MGKKKDKPQHLTVDIYIEQLEDYCRKVLAKATKELGRTPRSLSISWLDMAYWACAYNLYFNVNKNDSATLSGHDDDSLEGDL